MKNSLLAMMMAVGLTAGCKKASVTDASPIAGNWKLDKVEVDTTNGAMDKLAVEEAIVIMLVKKSEGKMRATFTNNKAVMLVDGDNGGDTSVYHLQHLDQNNYKMIVSKGNTNEEMTVDVERDKLRMKMKAVTYNFTRLP